MLLDFGGSMLLVSHDRWLLDRVATGILAFEGEGRVQYDVGDYSDYKERRLREEANASADRLKRKSRASAGESAGGVSMSEDEPGKGIGRPKKLSQKERRELDGLFEAIEAAEQGVEALQAKLADPETYQLPQSEIASIRGQLETAEAEALRLTERWEELEARSAAFEASQG